MYCTLHANITKYGPLIFTFTEVTVHLHHIQFMGKKTPANEANKQNKKEKGETNVSDTEKITKFGPRTDTIYENEMLCFSNVISGSTDREDRQQKRRKM